LPPEDRKTVLVSAGLPTKPIAVLYATRQGHARRVAGRVAAGLRKRGLQTEIMDLRELPNTFSLRAFCAVVLVASIHAGRHEREMIQFVQKHRSHLRSMPNAFLSVSLSEAGVERKTATAENHARLVSSVQDMVDRFLADTGWQPEHLLLLAGALRYSRSKFFARLVMRRVASKTVGTTDGRIDRDYTDWATLGQFVEQFANELEGRLVWIQNDNELETKAKRPHSGSPAGEAARLLITEPGKRRGEGT
jgi:menaquinone-dependent protoporphyrinogen oxidase